MNELEIELSKLSIEIKRLDDLATIEYKKKNLEAENKIDLEIEPLKKKRVELRLQLFRLFESTSMLNKGVLPKYENSRYYFSIMGKVCWVTVPLIREITYMKIGNKDMIYLKMDGTDGFTDSTQQIKMYLPPIVAEDMLNSLRNAIIKWENKEDD